MPRGLFFAERPARHGGYLKSLPTKNEQGVTVLTMDERACQIRALKLG